jgi:inositol-1,3,4-trisphosphate 5/6-kinase/inositol-tetrakisphosphate 1-kinase
VCCVVYLKPVLRAPCLSPLPAPLQVFVTPRASIPDLQFHQGQEQQQQCLLFDSLASLPTQLPPELTQPQQEQQQQQKGQQQEQLQQQQQPSAPPEEALKVMAAYLRQHLGLTLFGFDVVVAAHSSSSSSSSGSGQQKSQQQQQQQELVVIDVNYFPNYRGGKEVPALFRAALRQAWEQHQQQLLLR